MNYNEALAKLKACGQEHVLKHYDTLSDQEKEALLVQVAQTDFSVTENIGREIKRGKISAIGTMELSEIKEREDEFRAKGLQAIREGKLAAVLLAGGMGTRLGSDNPKCMYDIGITKHVYIMQRLIENVMEVTDEAGRMIPFYIMTSEKNHDATVGFMKEHDFFGYDPEQVHFFRQEMAPASDYEGKVYMESAGRIATSPNGNGGWFLSLIRAGLGAQLEKDGTEWLNVFAVDNVLQRIGDPVFLGAVLAEGKASGAKVVRKVSPDEKVGAMCLEDGKPSIVEYYDMTPELKAETNEKGDPAYNFGVILNYLFRVDDMHRIMGGDFPLHVVNKKIPHIDADGNPVVPEEPNGYKYEQLVLDMIVQLDSCLPFEVVREKEFAPIKNKTGVDSVESARELCKMNGIEL